MQRQGVSERDRHEARKAHNNEKLEAQPSIIKHASMRTTGKTINTIVGPISEWDCCPENLPNHPTMAFFGKRRTGKSTTITNIAYRCCKDIPFGLVVIFYVFNILHFGS